MRLGCYCTKFEKENTSNDCFVNDYSSWSETQTDALGNATSENKKTATSECVDGVILQYQVVLGFNLKRKRRKENSNVYCDVGDAHVGWHVTCENNEN